MCRQHYPFLKKLSTVSMETHLNSVRALYTMHIRTPLPHGNKYCAWTRAVWNWAMSSPQLKEGNSTFYTVAAPQLSMIYCSIQRTHTHIKLNPLYGIYQCQLVCKSNNPYSNFWTLYVTINHNGGDFHYLAFDLWFCRQACMTSVTLAIIAERSMLLERYNEWTWCIYWSQYWNDDYCVFALSDTNF